LRPPTLDELGLGAAIREAADQAVGPLRTVDAPNALRVTIDAPEPLPPLPAAVEVAAYRIAQEALTNVVRHAQARSCSIRIALDGQGNYSAKAFKRGAPPSQLELEICDDGAGLAAERHAGVGLRSMRERAEELGGWCVIENREEGGTRLIARLPIRRE
jgi:signal transduction histidine kinase